MKTNTSRIRTKVLFYLATKLHLYDPMKIGIKIIIYEDYTNDEKIVFDKTLMINDQDDIFSMYFLRTGRTGNCCTITSHYVLYRFIPLWELIFYCFKDAIFIKVIEDYKIEKIFFKKIFVRDLEEENSYKLFIKATKGCCNDLPFYQNNEIVLTTCIHCFDKYHAFALINVEEKNDETKEYIYFHITIIIDAIDIFNARCRWLAFIRGSKINLFRDIDDIYIKHKIKSKLCID